MRNNSLEEAQHLSKHVFEMFRSLPQETQEAYNKCMKKDAIFACALPAGIISALATYKLVPFKPNSIVRKASVAFMGLLGYTMGRLYYSIVCLEKHAPAVANMLKKKKGLDTSNYNQQSESLKSFGELTEQEPTWDSFNTYSDSNDDQLPTYNNPEEELMSNKPINLKPRVTYDDLRNQNRAEFYKMNQGYRYMDKEKQKRGKEFHEDTTFKSETKEDNIWS